jgi:hypothetical protein
VPSLLSSAAVLLHPKKRIFMHASKMLCQATRRSLGSGLEWRPLGCDLSNILKVNFREFLFHAIG